MNAATSVAELPIGDSGRRTDGSSRIRISCSTAADLAEFDDSLCAHVSVKELDLFICDHVIDKDTLGLAESFAMAAVLGSSGSTPLVQGLYLDDIGKFLFKDDENSDHFLTSMERRSKNWQQTAIPREVQESIIVDLEKNRCLAEAKALLIAAITHLQSITEPLLVSKMQEAGISNVLEDMERAGILTEQHLSPTTMDVLNRYIKVLIDETHKDQIKFLLLTELLKKFLSRSFV